MALVLAAARCDACCWVAHCWLLLTVGCKTVAPYFVLSNTIAVLAEYTRICTGRSAVGCKTVAPYFVLSNTIAVLAEYTRMYTGSSAVVYSGSNCSTF